MEVNRKIKYFLGHYFFRQRGKNFWKKIKNNFEIFEKNENFFLKFKRETPAYIHLSDLRGHKSSLFSRSPWRQLSKILRNFSKIFGNFEVEKVQIF